MWIKDDIIPSKMADVKVVKRDFLVVEASTMSYSFLNGDDSRNPFSRSLSVPEFYIWKIHRNHPMVVRNRDGFTSIWPKEELNENLQSRFPLEFARDRMAYDLATFVAVPFELSSESKSISIFNLGHSFYPKGNQNGRKASLYYIEHENLVHSQDNLKKISPGVMPSHVLNHLLYWLMDGQNIYSHEKTFNQRLEGRIEVALPLVRELQSKLVPLLEKRYKTRLSDRD